MYLSTSMNYAMAAALATIVLALLSLLMALFWLARNRISATRPMAAAT